MNSDSRRDDFEELMIGIKAQENIMSTEQIAKFAWEAAVAHTERRLLLSKIVLPERKEISNWPEEDEAFYQGFNLCLDSIKIVPVSVESLINHNEIEKEANAHADLRATALKVGDLSMEHREAFNGFIVGIEWYLTKLTERMGGE